MNTVHFIKEHGLFSLVIFGMAAFSIISFKTPYIETINASALAESQSAKQKIGLPKRLIIEKINMEAPVEYVEIAPSGSMGVPSNFTNVGWLKTGAKPGEIGNAAMDGHVDNAVNSNGVFKNLNLLRHGDTVRVIDNLHQILTFTVIKSELYEDKNAPLNEIFGTSAERHLNLITCDGIWNNETKSYNKRLVVFTKLTEIIGTSTPNK